MLRGRTKNPVQIRLTGLSVAGERWDVRVYVQMGEGTLKARAITPSIIQTIALVSGGNWVYGLSKCNIAVFTEER